MIEVMDGIRFLDHTGDIGFDLEAPTLTDLFKLAAQGLYGIMIERVPESREDNASIDLSEEMPDLLLRSFLSELLYRFLTHREILVDFSEFRIEKGRLTARASTARFDPNRDGLRTELKAVTYHQLDVRREGAAWKARIVFDL